MTLEDNKARLKSAGELEREISQSIQALYRSDLDHSLSRVTCQLFGRNIVIVLENSSTQPEKLLNGRGHADLAKEVRDTVDKLLFPKIVELIRTVLGVEVLDLVSDTSSKTEFTGIIAILSNVPDVRNPDVIPKTKAFNKRSSQTKR
ncbi:MAG: DUF2294 domain-containing protein [Leptolyngbyaceae cyanobacterium]